MTRDVINILFICTGNICRSPLAERLMRQRIDFALGKAARDIVTTSAGIRGLDRSPMDNLAADELRRLGGDPDGFQSRSLTAGHVQSADLVLAATRQHRSAVLTQNPDALRRAFTLLEFANLAPYTPCPPGATLAPAFRAIVEQASRRRGSIAISDNDIPDPYRQTPDVHRKVAAKIQEAVDNIIRALREALVI